MIMMSYTQLLVGVALHVLAAIWEQVRYSFKLPVRVRQRVDASDRFFAVCKLALAFTRGPGVRRDHPGPIRAIHLTKWLVKAPYTDENEEISLVIKNRIFGRS